MGTISGVFCTRIDCLEITFYEFDTTFRYTHIRGIMIITGQPSPGMEYHGAALPGMEYHGAALPGMEYHGLPRDIPSRGRAAP